MNELMKILGQTGQALKDLGLNVDLDSRAA
jgi:hypothetical protein